MAWFSSFGFPLNFNTVPYTLSSAMRYCSGMINSYKSKSSATPYSTPFASEYFGLRLVESFKKSDIFLKKNASDGPHVKCSNATPLTRHQRSILVYVDVMLTNNSYSVSARTVSDSISATSNQNFLRYESTVVVWIFHGIENCVKFFGVREAWEFTAKNNGAMIGYTQYLCVAKVLSLRWHTLVSVVPVCFWHR